MSVLNDMDSLYENETMMCKDMSGMIQEDGQNPRRHSRGPRVLGGKILP